MAKAQFKAKDTTIEKTFGSPKKQTLEAWFKAIRKVIPEVPDPSKTDWLITSQYTSEGNKWINFEMANSVGERAVILVDRQHSFLVTN